jgi:fructuronate reductase
VAGAIAARGTRWVTLTVTEKGYGPELAALLVQGLAQRHAAGLGGITIASCDNLSHNGRKLQALCVQTASGTDLALARWIQTACAFPNSMVDRIVPAATPERLRAAQEALGVEDAAALGTEAFWEWVIEHRFVDDADGAALARAGVTVVADVGPFEEAKLRMLNGSHTAMACMGAVAGLPVIAECIAQPAIHGFVHGLMTHEVAPHLARPDWAAYRDALLARFANPELKHSVHQIATDSSQKIPQRWPPSVLGQLEAGQPFERLAFAAAAWMRYCLGEDERGLVYAMSDPMAQQVQALARTHATDAAATVQALGRISAIWGDALPQHSAWLARVTHWLGRIQVLGVLAALAELNDAVRSGDPPGVAT